MKLIYKHNQEKHFKIIKYPDGQQNVELDLNYFNNPKDPVTIVASVRSFLELEVLFCLWSALVNNDFVVEQINYMYLMGMRSDRSFSEGQPNYFRDVMAPMASAFHRARIKVLYPHSKISLMSIRDATSMHIEVPDQHDCYVIGADQSACWSEPEYLDFMPHFSKKRNSNGEVEITLASYLHGEINDLPEHKPILIKDDLCDGGATFIAIAKYLEEHFPNRKRYLFIAHGLFTKGVDHVAAYYHKIITTNSYQEFDSHEKLQVIDVWR